MNVPGWYIGDFAENINEITLAIVLLFQVEFVKCQQYLWMKNAGRFRGGGGGVHQSFMEMYIECMYTCQLDGVFFNPAQETLKLTFQSFSTSMRHKQSKLT